MKHDTIQDRAPNFRREKCATAAAIHSQYPIRDDYDCGYTDGRIDAARAIRKRGEQ